ncbi:adenylate/guanylate cyclase domain-containing protein [Desulfuromonas carbonis]|uniref:CHASE2 domain-containing protein n=1 Tax=Desulfuromonas sp. DDH964 TaxID=1823759 RepID=UPI00078C48CF|nr:adenylate/guanylate cyclase domain-containing protein [Desulfuromonas sp. DDH964]AMV70903.1 Adenylate cyclase 1 [Desulfuromonas sp. DDH964]
MNARLRRWSGALLIGFLAALLGWGLGRSGLLEEFEWKTFDLRLRLMQHDTSPPDEIVMVLIDEASLRLMNPLLGRWPWPRSVHADVLDFLALAGARVVAFDILFTENEQAASSDGRLSAGDHRLVESVAAAGMVTSAVQFVHDSPDEYNHDLIGKPLPADFVRRFALPGLRGGRLAGEPYTNAYLPFPELQERTRSIGLVEFAPDRDGVYRHARLVGEYGGAFFPALSLSVLLDRYRPESAPEGEMLLHPQQVGTTPPVAVPLLADGRYLVKPYREFQTYSMGGILATIQKLMQGIVTDLPVDPEVFHDKIVFIGASAVGVEDLKPLPFGSLAPGVFLHGSIVGNILQQDFLVPVAPRLQLLLVVVGALAVAGLILIPGWVWLRMASPPLLILSLLGLAAVLFHDNQVLELTAPLVAMGSAWLGSFAWLSSTEGREKRKIRRMLGQYVSPVVLSTVIENSRSDLLQAEVGSRENLTILFSDIRGFTSLSENLPAEKVVEILNGYFKGMVEIIFRQQGTLDKFIGDAIMAFWGAPLKSPDHPLKAVVAAVGMMRWLEDYNAELKNNGLQPLAIGIGMHTGEVILGNIGSEQKLDYTIIGDNVNLCSRLEGLTKEYGAAIIVSETTWQAISGLVTGRILDVVRVKGKKRPIMIHQVFGLVSDPEPQRGRFAELARRSEAGFNHYLARQWPEAAAQFRNITEEFPEDRHARIFLERIARYQQTAPEADWDGAWTMQSK